VPAEVRVRRLAALLGRKGYPPGLAYRVAREAVAEGAHDGSVDDDAAHADPDNVFGRQTPGDD
jgi:regulatory protein